MRCLITEKFHPSLQSNLEIEGIICDVFEDIQTEEVMERINQYEILIVNSKIQVDKKFIDKAGNLKIIGRVGSGMEVIDLVYCKEKNIKVFNSPEGNCQAVAEHCLGLLLNGLNYISKANDEMNRGLWLREENRGMEISGKTIGIIGYGHTGKSFAKVLRGFDVLILAYDKYKENFGDEFVHESSLQEIFLSADIVSIHLPLNEETIQFVNESFLKSFAKPIFFLNTSRGKVCETKALLNALNDGSVFGAGLDVFENEKMQSFDDTAKQLWNLIMMDKRIIKTPHIAGWTHESSFKLANVLTSRIISELKAGL